MLNCGIERQCIGDIVLTEGGAVVFALCRTADYLMSSEQPLTRVGRDKVVLSYAGYDLVCSLKREFDEMSFTVASERIDCVAAEITRLSRENVKGCRSSLRFAVNVRVSFPDETVFPFS